MKSRILSFCLLVLLLFASGSADVIPTDRWIVVFGSVTLNGNPAALGTIIDAYDPDGVHCGQFMVNSEGEYGFMSVYADDLLTSGIDEGCDPGDEVTFYVNGLLAEAIPSVTWTVSLDMISADLSAGAEPQCGDADGSGAVDIDDAVFLITYIFGGGPAPDPLAVGDSDCSGAIDIDDVVVLIEYIFAGGNPPCDVDGNGHPDC